MINDNKISHSASMANQTALNTEGKALGLAKVVKSESLFAGARELIIAHAGDKYRLRLTNQNKLILTK
jgi:hemin uptake protein HemP